MLNKNELKLKVEYVSIDKLIPYANNAKEHDDVQIGYIENSIEEFGFSDPIGVWTGDDGSLNIVEGHGRVLAAKDLGIEKVPIIKLDHLTDKQRRAYVHVHNQTNLSSGFDDDILWEDLDTIVDYDWEDFGFEIDDAIEEYTEVEEDDFDESVVEKRCEAGDIWKLGGHKLICGSATNQEDVERVMAGELADLWLTDYPYGVSYVGKTEDALTIMNDSFKTKDEFFDFIKDAAVWASQSMKPGAAFYVFHSSSFANLFMNGLEEAGLETRETLIWVKQTMVMGRQDYQWKHEPILYGWRGGAAHNWYSDRSQTTVLEFDRPSRNDLHPTMKPLAILSYLMENSTKKGDLILDSFGGSGSTLIAADQIERRCNMIELDPHYCDVILHRYEEQTGDKVELLERLEK